MRFSQSVTAVEEPQVLGAYDFAYLAGGAQRVADSAVIALSERGLLKLSGPRVRAVGEVLPEHPVERALVASCLRNRSTASVQAALQRAPEVEAIGRRLAAQGLVKGSRCRLTRLGRRRLREAEGTGLPAYVLGGLPVLGNGPVRRCAVGDRPIPSGLGRSPIRLGMALDHDSDSTSELGNTFNCGSGSDSY
ncbi:TIGR04222 domain-containing membrane protein [Streptomyces sp. NPDC005017]|uniref:TIGR04222 domain-containing membrane protein n=1 Tax=Streptomyces sp. NPDC005017 TaxID=3364706 RepID=UPI00367B91E8